MWMFFNRTDQDVQVHVAFVLYLLLYFVKNKMTEGDKCPAGLYDVVLIRDINVGKTRLLAQYTKSTFCKQYAHKKTNMLFRGVVRVLAAHDIMQELHCRIAKTGSTNCYQWRKIALRSRWWETISIWLTRILRPANVMA